MSIQLCISASELRQALAAIEVAEKNGFMHCLAVVEPHRVGFSIEDCRAKYSDLIERAHPTDGNLNWGRFQAVTSRNTFVDGKLVPITPKERTP